MIYFGITRLSQVFNKSVAADISPFLSPKVKTMKKTLKHLVVVTGALYGLFNIASASALELNSDNSRVSLVSTKAVGDGKSTVAEVFSFPTLTGNVADDGTASVVIDLSSIQTGIDIRNERMSEFFFEVANHPEAVISAQVSESALKAGTQQMDLQVTVAMHGSEAEYTVPVVVTATDKNVTVVAVEPVLVAASSFELESGLGKLTELAGLFHIPTTVPVSFSLSFDR